MDDNLPKPNRSKTKLERNKDAMRDAIALLKSEGVRFSQPDQYTLQFRDYSYWPGTQKLYREGDEHSSSKQGLDDITVLIRSFKCPTMTPIGRTTTASANEFSIG